MPSFLIFKNLREVHKFQKYDLYFPEFQSVSNQTSADGYRRYWFTFYVSEIWK